MKKILFCLSIISTAALANSELYQGSEEIKEVLKQNNSMYEPNYFSLFLGLFFVIGLVYLTGIVYQKLTKVKLSQQENELNKIQIVSTTSLGQNKALHVIKINDEYSLIGATQNNISFLKDIKQNIEG
ncbi:MAG: flagellar biosynthetic protein FliO [Candidatus Gastranaerophilales bacterium]|nr:flagellar biosynthetic protein FliO [Candidatus Gastranaerophilales bacterium]